MISRPDNRRRIGLFGGSFNPPHLGHTAICNWLFARGIVDELWVIPCFIHPFGKELLPFEHRLAMCKMVFYKLSREIYVLDVEQKLGGTSYTLRTIEHLRSEYPEYRFSLITGDDVKSQVGQWRDYDNIRNLVDIVNLPRGPKSPIPDISSSEVRRRIENGEPYSDLVEDEVAVYIITKALFRDSK